MTTLETKNRIDEYLINAAEMLLEERGVEYNSTQPLTAVCGIIKKEMANRHYPYAPICPRQMFYDWLEGCAWFGDEINVGYEYKQTFDYILEGFTILTPEEERKHIMREFYSEFIYLIKAESYS